MQKRYPLSRLEEQILRMVHNNLSNKEITNSLNRGIRAIEARRLISCVCSD